MNAAKTQKIAAIEAAWNSDKTRQTICLEFGISYRELNKLAAAHRWRKKPSAPRQKDDEMLGPSQEEIAQRAATVRARWSEAEQEKRWVGPRRQAWTPRQYVCNPKTGFIEAKE